MKAENLSKLKAFGFNVPDFVLDSESSYADFLLDGKLYAVRSSADIEDTEESANAGMFLTRLNVPYNEVNQAIDDVRGSYNGIYGDVIIQEMIDADYSGVAFTVNPIGVLNEYVIVVGAGVGNGVSDEKSETTTYYYNTDDKCFNVLDDVVVKVDAKLLFEIVDIITKIKSCFEKDMDVEFAVKDSVIYILQARPITHLNFDDIVVLDSSNIAESYPSAASPATQDFVHIIYRDIFKRCVLRMTGSKKLVAEMKDVFDTMVVSYNDKLYYRLNSWYEVLRILPFSNKIISIWQEMLGIENKYVTESKIHVPLYIKFVVLIRFIYYLFTTPSNMRKLNSFFDRMYPLILRAVRSSYSIIELVPLLYRVESGITDVWDITLINDMYTFLFTSLAGGKKNKQLASVKNIESMRPVYALRSLVRVAIDYGKDSEMYSSEFKKFIKLYGDRVAGELMLEQKTYRTNPELLEAEVDRVLSCGDISPYSRIRSKKSYNPFTHFAKIGIANRETSRLNRSRLFGLAREILIRTGKALVDLDVIEDKDDVFYLHFDEFFVNADFRDTVNSRRHDISSKNAGKLPTRLVFGNGIVERNYTRYAGDVNKTVLHGTATSIGRVKAEAVVIENPSLDIDTAGKIIVAHSTDPGWVYLIEKSAGIIAEHGSLLSHTAIISRELNKPALVNVKDAVDVIHTGDMIDLDTVNGLVILEH